MSVMATNQLANVQAIFLKMKVRCRACDVTIELDEIAKAWNRFTRCPYCRDFIPIESYQRKGKIKHKYPT